MSLHMAYAPAECGKLATETLDADVIHSVVGGVEITFPLRSKQKTIEAFGVRRLDKEPRARTAEPGELSQNFVR